MRLGLAAVLATVSFVSLFGTSCSYRNEDINRVVDPYWSKEYFTRENEWYYRATVVDMPPEAGWLSIADGDWLMLDKIRWEVTEKMLIGWRTYAEVPGTEAESFPGADEYYKGEMVAAFPIVDQFDIRRGFDQGTGEESNVISENRDRLWYDRAFIRVDWRQNMIATLKWHIQIEQLFNESLVQNNDPGDPKRWRFEDDYFEVTTRTRLSPDLFAFVGWYGIPYSGDAAGEVADIRHAFMKVPKSDYEPLPMPPTVFLEDDEGRPVLDANGYAVRVPINDRFAFYGTLGRNQFDQNRGIATSGQIWNAARFNIWERSTRADGASIPMDQREPKAIVYYTNVDHPRAYMNGSRRVAREWNRVFRDLIWKVQPQRYSGELDDTNIPSDVPEMFILRENDCNPANVKNVIATLTGSQRADVVAMAARDGYANTVPFDGTVESAERRINNASDDENLEPYTNRVAEEAQAFADLERVCASLEYVTGGDPTLGRPGPEGVKPFTYQRLGDPRYNLMNMIPGVFQSGWSGLGPMFTDPLTGETISATANVAAYHIDSSAASAAQWVEVMNGQVDPTDFVFGYDISAYMRQKLVQLNGLQTWSPQPGAYENMDRYFSALKERATGDIRDAIGETPPGRMDAELAKLAGTEQEQLLISPDDIMAFGGVAPGLVEQTNMDEALLNRVSLARDGNKLTQLKHKQERIERMAMRAMDPPEMINPNTVGRAIALRDMSYRERFKKLQEDIYVAVMLHEVGHNVGMFHNMAGSSDALNFGQKFWDVQALPADIDDAIAQLGGATDETSIARTAQLQTCADLIAQIPIDGGDDGAPDFGELDPDATAMTTQECLRQTEVMYSSIMDYHASWNADFGGLGPYDAAAVKFAYGQLVETFAEGALLDRGADTRTIKRKIFLDGWQTIPTEIVDGYENVNNRTYTKMSWTTSSTRQAPLPNEVPYKWGIGAEYTPDDKLFDFGADYRTNARNELARYYDSYFFTHFSRDRLWEFGDGINNAIWSDIQVLWDFTTKMQWYFFFKATDPEFTGSWAEQDLLATTLTGLNLLGQVMGHPQSGLHVTTRKSDVFGLLNEPTTERQPVPSDIMLPWTSLGECTTRQVAETVDVNGDGRDDGVFARPRAGFDAGIVPLGEGRPFFIGLTDDYEDWYVKYVGSYWSKVYSLQFLGYNDAFFPRTDGYSDPRRFDISWYRLFPKQTAKVYHDLITENFADLGPVVLPSGDPDVLGGYQPRLLINADGTEPDYSAAKRVMPSVSFNHQFYAMFFANALLSSPYDDTLDLARTMVVALDGAGDDMSAFDNADPADVISFVHPVTGMTFRALRAGDYPISYNLLVRLNTMKDRFDTLNGCVAAMDDADALTDEHLTNEYCWCIDYYSDPVEGDCTIERFEAVGTGRCTDFQLRNRRDSARESMDDLVDYVNQLRTFNYYWFN